MKSHLKTHLLMLLLTCIWTLDAVTVSSAVDHISQIFLLCCKYLCALPVLLIFVLVTEGRPRFRVRDLPFFILSTLLGDIAYFYFEYTALKYLPAGIVTIMLGLVPAASYLTDCAVTRRRPQTRLLLAIGLILAGLCPVVLSGETQAGHLIGYLACALCVAAWVGYGYVLRRLDRTYSTAAITLGQQVLALGIMVPFALANIPSSLPLREILLYIAAAGILSDGIGFLIEVRGMTELGTTVTGIYLNLLPVFTAAAGFLFLHQTMTVPQMLGAAIVIVCGFYVLRKTDSLQ